MKEFVEGLTIKFYHCAAIPDEQGAESVINLFQGLGGQFLTTADKPLPDPRSKIDRDGNLDTVHLEHEQVPQDGRLRYAISQNKFPPDAKGRASFFFIRDRKLVAVGQDISSNEQELVDLAAFGLLSFTVFLYPHLRPQYGWVDESGPNLPSREQTASYRPRYLYWANVFGPEFVRAAGPGFFDHLPGWRLVHTPDGGYLYMTLASYWAWWLLNPAELDYLLVPFRARWPDIEIYKAEAFD
jgi:hypothetical protein